MLTTRSLEMRKLTLSRWKTTIYGYLSCILFLLLSLALPSVISGQILIEPIIVSQPEHPVQEGDSICYIVNITNLSPDTIRDLNVVIDPDVLISLGSTILYPNGSSSGSFVTTGSGCYVLSAADVGNPFIYNTFSGSGSTMSGSPLMPLTGTGESYACFKPLVCVGTVNVSIDENCLLSLSPNMLLDSLYYPDSIYSILVTDLLGRPIEDNIFTGSMVGQQYKYEVRIPSCPDLPACWGYLNIEYKLAPEIVCISDTLTCAQFQRFIIQDPSIITVCSEPEIIAGESVRTELCGIKPGFIAKIQTVYRIRDQFGNFSDTCTQEVYIREPNIQMQLDLGHIVWPPNALTFSCSDNIFNADGSLSTTVSGVPRWDGVNMLDLNNLACNFYTRYEDTPLNTANPCDMIFLRKWIIEEWKCSGGFTSHMRTQVITLRDDDAPSITLPAKEISRSINQIDCFAEFDLIPAIITDNCQPDSLIFITTSYAGGTFNQNGGRVRMPLGRNVVYFRAQDICGNRSVDSMIVNVIDDSPPVAICLRNYSTTITDTQIKINVDRLDETSYDACGVTKRCAIRMDDQALIDSLDADGDGEILFSAFAAGAACGRDYSDLAYTRDGQSYIRVDDICSGYVMFCCSDGGNEVPVILRFYDAAENMSVCMVMVRVLDKTPATVTALPDLEISCDYVYSDSSVFGWFRPSGEQMPLRIPREFVKDSSGPLVDGIFFDNCGITITEQPVEITRDLRCGTGQIIRRFVVRDASAITQSFTQRITITGDENTRPLEFASFPADFNVGVCSSNNAILPSVTGEPVVNEVGCSQYGIGYTDRYFIALNPTNDYCMKIERTWSVLDWCRDPRAENLLSRKQVILVTDNEAPSINERDTLFATVNASGRARVLFRNSASDCVAGQALEWDYVLRNASNAIIAQDTLAPKTTGEVSFVSELTVGTYRLTWVAKDVCGNEATVVQVVVIRARTASAIIAGHTYTAAGAQMDKVEVYLQDVVNTAEVMSETNLVGEYAFGEMPIGGQYIIDPKKTDGLLNGVSTLDLILMQKHVLGLQNLAGPYAFIAADINKDGVISALDLVEMRSVLLGKKIDFTNNDSWRFFWKGQDLADALDNEDDLIETYEIDALKENMTVDFIGIKIGDVTGDAKGNSALAGLRSKEFANIKVTQRPNTIAFKATKDNKYSGLQLAIDLAEQPTQIIGLVSSKLQIADNMWFWNETSNTLYIAWSNLEGVQIVEGDILFEVHTADNIDAEYIHLDNARLASEWITSDLTVQGISFIYENSLTDGAELMQNNPNPWADFTIFKLRTPVSGAGMVRVYDVHNRVIVQRDQYFNAGINEIRFESREISENGIYFIEIETNNTLLRQKMLRIY